jgi:predicted NAD/FAD-dependent oxidoreductase
MKDFCIVGSGIAGSTIASLLSKKYTVEIFEKARGPGGRASNRRYKDNLSFDHGLQYISPKSKGFKKYVFPLRGLVKSISRFDLKNVIDGLLYPESINSKSLQTAFPEQLI